MIKQSVCQCALLDFLKGIHQPGDTYKIALFTASANLGYDTKTYTPVGEAKGPGYEAGGQALSGIKYDYEPASVGWSASPRWPNSSIRARGALIFNASKDNRALAVLDFGEDKISSVGPWFINDGELLRLISLA